MADRRATFVQALDHAPIYAVTDDSIDEERLLTVVDMLLNAGVRVFQYRDKVRSDGERVRVGAELVRRVHALGGLVIVNDRVDIAIASGADGAHLGQDDLPLDVGRALIGPDLLLGASASFLEEIPVAIAAGVDYLGFGAVFPTATKRNAEYAGLNLLEQACRACAVPLVAIGGITAQRAPSVMARGPSAAAVVSALFGAPDPRQAAIDLLGALRAVDDSSH